jgi:hypothetical protein
VLEKQGDQRGAQEKFEASLAIREVLCSGEPGNLAYQRELAYSLFYAAGCSSTRVAEKLLERSEMILEKLLATGALMGSLQSDLQCVRDRLVNVRRRRS